MTFITDFVRGLNSVNSNVWAFAVLLIGVFLALKGDRPTGESLMMGAFALLRTGGSTTNIQHADGIDAKVT